jgi:hypothetical protein
MSGIIDKEFLYNLIQNEKPMPSREDLFDAFFIALVQVEEHDFKSVRHLLNINGKTLCHLKNKHFPELVKKMKKRIKRVP